MALNRGLAMRIGLVLAGTLAAAAAQAGPSPMGEGQTSGAGTASSASDTIVVKLGQPEGQLTGAWRYHAGDDLRWAQPGWPDSGWTTIDPYSGEDKDYPVAPFAWVRRRVRIERAAPGQKLVFYVRARDTYQVYWNGQKIGQEGEVPPRINFPYYRPRVFELPLGNEPVTEAVVAVRYWCQRPYSIAMSCGLKDAPYIGDLSMEQDELEGAAEHDIMLHLATLVSGILTLLAGLLALAAGLRRRDTVLLLAGALLFSIAAQNFMDGVPTLVSSNWGDGIFSLANFIATAASILLVAKLMGVLERRRLGRVVLAVAAVIVAWGFVDGALCVMEARATHWMQVIDGISTLKDLFGPPVLVLVIVAGFRSRMWKANWPFVASTTFYGFLISVFDWGKQFRSAFGHRFDWIDHRFSVHSGLVYVEISVMDIVTWVMILALLYTVVQHLAAERRKQERAQQELDAAREVQRVMVPEELPHIPGYAVESVYRPAAEVGGDFFQVIRLKSGHTLLAIGDVSGKGLRAAMIVSMIVGTLRSVSGFTEEPAEILSELNRRLCGRMGTGFATCLAVRLEEHGHLTMANAGHLPPYMNGVELELGGSLPLGLVESAAYEQTTVEMAAADVAVLLTDGICEAQNERRVLFGFARVESMLRQGASAGDVAEAAQQHGQNDDLTVLRVVRAA